MLEGRGARRCRGRRVGGPLRAVFDRGIREGVLRSDLVPQAQVRLFSSLVTGALQAGLQRDLGIEEAAATLASFFLEGARYQSPTLPSGPSRCGSGCCAGLNGSSRQ